MTRDDDIAMGEVLAWLKKQRLVAQVTLSGRLTLTPIEVAYSPEYFEHARKKAARKLTQKI